MVVSMEKLDETVLGRTRTTIGISQHTSRKFDQLFHDIVYHPLIKGMLLQGHSRSTVAHWLRKRKRDVLDVANSPFTALSTPLIPGIDPRQVFVDLWKHRGPFHDADEALIDCIIYDGLEWPDDRPGARLARYRVTTDWILRRVALTAVPSDDDQSTRLAVDSEHAAELLGCSDSEIATARNRHSAWTVPLRDLNELRDIVAEDYPRRFAVEVARCLLLRRFADEIPPSVSTQLDATVDGDPLGTNPVEARVAAYQLARAWVDDPSAVSIRRLLDDVLSQLDWAETQDKDQLVSDGARRLAPHPAAASLIWAVNAAENSSYRQAASWAFWTLSKLRDSYASPTPDQVDAFLAAGGDAEILDTTPPVTEQGIRDLLAPAMKAAHSWESRTIKEMNRRKSGARERQDYAAVVYVRTLMSRYFLPQSI